METKTENSVNLIDVMTTKDALLPAYATINEFEAAVNAAGKDAKRAVTGYYSGLSALIAAYVLQNECSVTKGVEVYQDVFSDTFKGGTVSKVKWAVGLAVKALKADVDESTDDDDAIASCLGFFQCFAVFSEYNKAHEPKAKADPKAKDVKAETVAETDQTDKGVKPQSEQTADEALAVMMAAYRHLMKLAQGGDTLAETHLAGFMATANEEAAIMVELKAA